MVPQAKVIHLRDLTQTVFHVLKLIVLRALCLFTLKPNKNLYPSYLPITIMTHSMAMTSKSKTRQTQTTQISKKSLENSIYSLNAVNGHFNWPGLRKKQEFAKHVNK